MLIRHIAGVPTATEQRCVRCCEVLGDNKGTSPTWPGETTYDLTGECCEACGRTMQPHGVGQMFCRECREILPVAMEDCKPVDLNTVELRESAPVAIAPGVYPVHKFWGRLKMYPCGSCGMSFESGNHLPFEEATE